MTSLSHLAIDGIGAKHGGAATVLLGLVQAALTHPDIDKVSVFCSPAGLRLFDFPEHPALEIIECRTVDRNRLARVWWFEQGLARAVKRIGAGRLVCLGSGGVLPSPNVVSATLVQRIQPFSPDRSSSDDLTESLRKRALAITAARSIRGCSWVFVQTQTVKDRVVAKLDVDASRVLVFQPTASTMSSKPVPAHPSIDPMRRTPPGQRVLYVGSATSHKDLRTLRKAMWLVRRLQPSRLFLTLEPDHPAARGEGLHGLGYLADPAVLRQAYEEADVVVLTSLEETVGLPLVEAMHFGKPIVVPDLPYAHDVCGDAALYFTPKDPRAAAQAIIRLLQNESLRRELGAVGRRIETSRHALRPYHGMIDSLRHPPPSASERHAPHP